MCPAESHIKETSDLMLAARLHAPGDLRVDSVPVSRLLESTNVLIKVDAVGICGSDLHTYRNARIGDSVVKSPFILCHEFSGIIEEIGAQAEGGAFELLVKGSRVAVDPAISCGRCEACINGNPNLCASVKFCGVYPENGCLCEKIVMPGRCCFQVPETFDSISAAMVEPLAVAIHAVDLAKARVGMSAAVIGSGPIGLLCLQVLRLAGAGPIFVDDLFRWRRDIAAKFGGVVSDNEQDDFSAFVLNHTKGVGVDLVIEAAWGGDAIRKAATIAKPGSNVIIVGIPDDDDFSLRHSLARRKGLTIKFCRRSKNCYPRAIKLIKEHQVDIRSLVSHRFKLIDAPLAFKKNAGYEDNVIKVMIDI